MDAPKRLGKRYMFCSFETNLFRMVKGSYYIIFVSGLLMYSCGENEEVKENQNSPENTQESSKTTYDFAIKELNDDEYPNNPDIGFRSERYSSDFFEEGKVNYKNDFIANFDFYSDSDTISIQNFDLSEFVPTIPARFQGKDDYLCEITLVNQEWNRNQVNLNSDKFSSTNDDIVRLDISRNCLNAYLWEVIAYTEEEGKVVPLYHGWFDFPSALYAKLFEEKNSEDYADYKKPLEKWIDPENKTFDFNLLRNIEEEIAIDYTDKSDEMYPLKGARLKKYKEIIVPDTFQTMRDLQSDSTTFATFSAPGYYNKKDPRHTELGRFYTLENVALKRTSCEGKSDLRELKFTFSDRNGDRVTHLYFGGLMMDQFPELSVEAANDGWKNSMGFGNHPFYQDYKEYTSWSASTSCYYGFLTNEKDQWLDSHKVGIDGPIIHWDAKKKNRLHVWLLSFERHALVGHYVIDIKR